MSGVSGNPGGRPKGLSRRVRELVGDDGHAIAEFMFTILSDETECTADRMEAAKWLADRGFGKSVQPMSVDMNQYSMIDVIDITKISTKDLKALVEILSKYKPDVAEAAESGEIQIGLAVEASSRER
ncbi:MAG: hypothetical protein HW413_2269 [Thermoleophilia bacterium]|nr:hypothetical protein [Thermoleophilia bacterium]